METLSKESLVSITTESSVSQNTEHDTTNDLGFTFPAPQESKAGKETSTTMPHREVEKQAEVNSSYFSYDNVIDDQELCQEERGHQNHNLAIKRISEFRMSSIFTFINQAEDLKIEWERSNFEPEVNNQHEQPIQNPRYLNYGGFNVIGDLNVRRVERMQYHQEVIHMRNRLFFGYDTANSSLHRTVTQQKNSTFRGGPRLQIQVVFGGEANQGAFRNSSGPSQQIQQAESDLQLLSHRFGLIMLKNARRNYSSSRSKRRRGEE